MTPRKRPSGETAHQLATELRAARGQTRALAAQLGTAKRQLAEKQQEIIRLSARQQCADEEYAAANEELRNSNDELEISRVQLQGLNEELQAVNVRLQGSIGLSELQIAQLQAILDSLNDGVVISDLDGRLFHWNPAALAMHGLEPEEAQRLQYATLAEQFDVCTLDGRLLPLEERPLSRILRGERLKNLQLSIRRRGADWQRIFSYGGTSVRDKRGNPVLAVISIGDVTEHQEAVQALVRAHDELELRVRTRTEELARTVETLKVEVAERQRAEASLRTLNALYALLSAIDLAIVRACDRDAIFRDFCRIAVEHGGFLLAWVGIVDEGSDEIRQVAACGATSYLDGVRVSVDERRPEGRGPTGTSVRNGTHHICNDFLNDPCVGTWQKKGVRFGFRSSAAIALAEEGRVIGALTVYAGEKDFFDQQHMALLVRMGADISFALDNLKREARRRQAERALQDETLERLATMEHLREKERLLIQQSRQAALGEMIGNIAHQWRQPLNTLGLLVQELQMSHECGQFSGEALEKSVDDAMQVIRHMSQTIDDFRHFFQPDKEKVTFRVAEVVDKVVNIVGASLKQHRVELAISTSGEALIHGYPSEYSQVLLNVLLNARDVFVERNVENPRIDLTVFEEQGRAVVQIDDNAGGIPAQIVDKIFDPYFTTKSPDKGTGVGLHMSKAIIEKNMKGSLTARNHADGARFRIEV